MKVKEFHIEDSQQNKNQKILIAVDESGKKYVVSGNPYDPTHLVPYELAFDTQILVV